MLGNQSKIPKASIARTGGPWLQNHTPLFEQLQHLDDFFELFQIAEVLLHQLVLLLENVHDLSDAEHVVLALQQFLVLLQNKAVNAHHQEHVFIRIFIQVPSFPP